MSLLTEASLLITPNAVEEGKLFSIIPTDGSGDLTVSRATTATRVNSAGLVEVVPYNLLQRSEEFDNLTVWPGSAGVTRLANQGIAPNGTNTMDLITFPISGNSISQSVTVISGTTYTFSVWLASQSGTQTVEIGNINSGIYQSVTVTTTPQRFEVTQVASSTNRFPAIRATAAYSILLWGAQLVTGTSAKEYLPTTDRLNVPRLDYTNGSCPSILVEPQRTNLFLNSVFNGTGTTPTSWSAGFVTGSSAPAISTMSTIGQAYTFTTSASRQVINQLLSQVSGTTYSCSVYVENVTGTIPIIDVLYFNGTGTLTYYKDGVLISSSTAIVSGSRYTAIFVATATLSQQVRIGNGCTASTTGSVRLSMPQLEAGSYATSYIPTVASTVTRNADVISKTGISSLIGQTEGTVFIDAKLSILNASNQQILVISDGLSVNRIRILSASASRLRILYQLAGATTYDFVYSENYINLNIIKIAFTYKSGDIKTYINGSLVNTSSSTYSISNPLIDLSILSNGIDEGLFNSVQLYKTALTDTELITLTTI